MADTDKITRILTLYSQLIEGKEITKTNFCLEHGIQQRSFDRDIEDLRLFLSERYSLNELIYSRKDNSYHLSNWENKRLLGEESAALVSMIIFTKSFRRDEIEELLKNLIEVTDGQHRELIFQIVKNRFSSRGLRKTEGASLKTQWDIERCILGQKMIVLDYKKGDGEYVQRELKPMEVIYDDGYAYLVAYRCDEQYFYPAFYRLDRIRSFKIKGGIYGNRVWEEYKKLDIKSHLKYMQAGELLEIKVRCKTAKKQLIEESFEATEVTEEKDDVCVISIRSFEQGFLQWILGQGYTVEVLEPVSLRQKIKGIINQQQKLYEREADGDGKDD